MARPAKPPSNFTSDLHTLYAGWIIGLALRSGLPVEPVRDTNGNYTNRIRINVAPGGNNPPSFTLIIPPPPDGWDLFHTDITDPMQPAADQPEVPSESG